MSTMLSVVLSKFCFKILLKNRLRTPLGATNTWFA